MCRYIVYLFVCLLQCWLLSNKLLFCCLNKNCYIHFNYYFWRPFPCVCYFFFLASFFTCTFSVCCALNRGIQVAAAAWAVMLGARVSGAGLLAAMCAAIGYLFNAIQPDSYMVGTAWRNHSWIYLWNDSSWSNYNWLVDILILQDEEFHVRQARQYCLHNFSHWDPMITTPPGLYVGNSHISCILTPSPSTSHPPPPHTLHPSPSTSTSSHMHICIYRYVSSLLWVEPLSLYLGVPAHSLCSPAVLRTHNVVLIVALFMTSNWLLGKLHRDLTTLG